MIPGNRRLSGHQELAVCQYLDCLDNIGLPARHFMITHFANAILRRSHPADSDDPPSQESIGPAAFWNDIRNICFVSKGFKKSTERMHKTLILFKVASKI